MPIVAKSLDARAPGAATTIDSAAGRFSTQLHNSTVSTLVVTQRGSEVSPGQGVQATHGANALVQRLRDIAGRPTAVAADGTSSNPVSIEVAVPADGSDASKWVQLWTLTKGLAPADAATYTIQYRAPGQADSQWRSLGEVTMSVSAASPGANASVTVSGDGRTLTGSGWVFNDSTTGAVPGLGDALVSGRVAPDVLRVRKVELSATDRKRAAARAKQMNK